MQSHFRTAQSLVEKIVGAGANAASDRENGKLHTDYQTLQS